MLSPTVGGIEEFVSMLSWDFFARDRVTRGLGTSSTNLRFVDRVDRGILVLSSGVWVEMGSLTTSCGELIGSGRGNAVTLDCADFLPLGRSMSWVAGG